MKFQFTRLFVLIAALAFSAGVFAQKDRTIAEVQGDSHMSKFDGSSARLKGIVTARVRNGFFMQTPDAEIDADPKTSEGIFVFTKTEPKSEATIGNLVSVSGIIMEFRPKTAPNTLAITQLSMRPEDSIKVLSSGNALPKSIFLTAADFAGNDFGQLEKYEGMRVAAESLTVVAPTDGRYDLVNNQSFSNGVFYAVLKGYKRAFREVGMDVMEYFASKDRDSMKKNFPKILIFDSNPEVIRIESSAQLGAQTIDVTSNAEIKNLSGVLNYAYDRYSILTDVGNKTTISGSIKSNALPALKDDQFSVAGMNLENFFDDDDDPAIKEDIVTREAFESRLKKISLAIRDYLRYPDVIGVTEAENLSGLKRLAARINSDAVAANLPDPKYEAYLIDGNDGRGIDVGYLVKSARVNVVKVEQLGKDEKFKNPIDKDQDVLNDRPPLLIQVSINVPNSENKIAFTIINNHLKSFLGYNDVKDNGLRVRVKKKLQAEYIAKIVQVRQKADPNENIILMGDFNFYQFNDGILDVIGTIKGTPAAKDAVLFSSEDLVEPDLINLVDLIQPDQKYSYSFDGNAQVLDHILINQTFRKHLVGFGFGRINADFPEVYRNDINRVEKYSDHDPAIAYFTFNDKK